MKASIALAITGILSAASYSAATANSDATTAHLAQRDIIDIAQFFNDAASHLAPRHASPPSLDASDIHPNHARRVKRAEKSGGKRSKRGTCPKRANASSVDLAATPQVKLATGEQVQAHDGKQGSDDPSDSSNGGDSNASPSSTWVALSRAPILSGATKTSSSNSEASPTSKSSNKHNSNSDDSGSKSPVITPSKPSHGSTGSALLGGAGLIGFVDSKCGKSGAVPEDDATKIAGPNGAMDWLNCGLYDDDKGWNPPMVRLQDVLVMQLDEALEDENSPFQPCKPHVDIFDKYAKQYDLPAILIASIAMQESTCNQNASGDDGSAYGLMQITQDKCTSGISCSDPDYNVKTGTAYLKSRIDANGGNILLGLGEYNGWYKGLTMPKLTAIKSQCCECQQNAN